MNRLPQIKIQGTLYNRTYDALKKSILNLDLVPGSSITEEELSAQLGVSRTPVRSAVQKLMFEGLIKTVPGKGAIVSELTLEQLKKLFDVRESLECLTVKLLASVESRPDFSKIDQILSDQTVLSKNIELNFSKFLREDAEFHKELAVLTENEFLVSQLEHVRDNCARYLNAVPFSERVGRVIGFHADILQAIKEGNPEKAQRMMAAHIIDTKESIVPYTK